MKVKIRNVSDYDNHEKERLVLDVIEDTDIGEYLVLDTTYTAKGGVSNKARHPYWFPDKKVKKGDIVVLYTKRGKQSSTDNGTYTSHFFYWGLDSSVWNDEGDCAVLLHIDEWSAKKSNQ